MVKTSTIEDRLSKWKSPEGIAILYDYQFLDHFRKSEILKIREERASYKLDNPNKTTILKQIAFNYISKKGAELGAQMAIIMKEIKSDKPSKYDVTVYYCVKNSVSNRKKYFPSEFNSDTSS